MGRFGGVFVLALLGCSAPEVGPRVVVLETEAYACGAEEGLGCGLELAPALARIDALEGVAASGTAWDGHHVRIDVAGGADVARVVEAAAAALAPDAEPVPADRAAELAGGRWYDAEGTRALSRHEAGVLARGFAAALAEELALADERHAQLAAAFRAALERGFERAHDAGGGLERLREAMTAERAALGDTLDFLDEEQRAAVLAFVDARLRNG